MSMKKIFTILFLSALLVPMRVMANAEVKVRPIGENRPDRITPSLSESDVLVNEDFSGFTSGTPENPDMSQCLADKSGQLASDWLIDSSLTHNVQWRGHLVYQAGGCCFIDNSDPQVPSYLYTPFGDYSGELKITFLARAVKTQAIGGGTLSGTSLGVGLMSVESGMKLDCDIPTDNIRLYPDQGWCEIEITCNNLTAANDAAIGFFTSGGVLIDEVRVTASYENFIASPVLKPITDVKPDGFTVNWDGVRKAYNYYVYLYTLEGYDETGQPIYKHEFSPEHIKAMEETGMTVEEYIEMIPEQFLTWEEPGLGKASDRSFTFTGLDPEEEYYYDVRAHYVYDYSDPNITHANVVSRPTVSEATGFASNSFTANWEATPKATSYDVTLYGVNHLEADAPNHTLLYEDFDATSEYTNAETYTGAINGLDEDFDINLLTSTPGWKAYDLYGLSIYKGHVGFNEMGGMLETPILDVASDDHIDVYIKMESPLSEFILYLKFAGTTYQIPVSGSYYDGGVRLLTNGYENSTILLYCDYYVQAFIDQIEIQQPRKAGDRIYTWLEQRNVEAPETSITFDELTPESWSEYGYAVVAVKTDDDETVRSEASDRMLVDIANKKSYSGINEIPGATATEAEPVEVARFTLEGRCISLPVKGINIVRYSDGTVKKVLVK